MILKIGPNMHQIPMARGMRSTLTTQSQVECDATTAAASERAIVVKATVLCIYTKPFASFEYLPYLALARGS